MARSTNDLNAVRMMLGPGIMYWTETMLTLVLAIAVMAVGGLAAGSDGARAGAAGQLRRRDRFGRTIHTRFERIQKNVLRYQQPGAGEPGGRPRRSGRMCRKKPNCAQFEELNRDYIAREHPAGRASGHVHAAAAGADRPHVSRWCCGRAERRAAGGISLGSFVMFNIYMGMLVWPMIAFGWVVNLMQRGTASLDAINELLQQRPTIAEPAGPRTLARARGRSSSAMSRADSANARAPARRRSADSGGSDGRDRGPYGQRQDARWSI